EVVGEEVVGGGFSRLRLTDIGMGLAGREGPDDGVLVERTVGRARRRAEARARPADRPRGAGEVLLVARCEVEVPVVDGLLDLVGELDVRPLPARTSEARVAGDGLLDRVDDLVLGARHLPGV